MQAESPPAICRSIHNARTEALEEASHDGRAGVLVWSGGKEDDACLFV